MEVEADPNLLVVNLDHCVSSETRQFGQSSCIYTTTITPVQCIGDINQSLSRIQHLTELQHIQYPQVEVSYNHGSLQQSNGRILTRAARLYQAPPPLIPLHHSLPTSQSYPEGFLTPLSVVPTPSIHDYTRLITPSEVQNISEDSHPRPLEAISSVTPPADVTLSSDKSKKDYLVKPEPPPADDYQYYKEIEKFLVAEEVPANASHVYCQHLKKRAQNYILIKGVLHHNPKQPKRVIMTKEEQLKLLESYHIAATTGVHIGIKKMFSKLKADFFWRGMYVSIATYVRKCTRCMDFVNISAPEIVPSDDQQPAQISKEVQTTPRIWTDVEIQLCGPYKVTNNRSSHIAVIVDPESKFLLACALSSSGLATRLTQFIMTSLFSFGFARAHLVTSTELYSAVHDEFSQLTRDLRDCNGLLCKRETAVCGWVNSLLKILVENKPSQWDRELDKFLYLFRSGEMDQYASICASDKDCIGTVCPFYSMFQRPPSPLSSVASSDNKENSSPISLSKRRLKKEKCLQISNGGNNAISLTASAQKDPSNCDHIKDGLKTNKNVKKQVHETSKNIGSSICNEDRDSSEPLNRAVHAIKNLLDETRSARQRRGSYNKYSDKLRERMAIYALKHGNQAAAKHFSAVLGTQVNDSTIRNLVKSRTCFNLSQRKEIAKYAFEKGVSAAAKHFSPFHNISISHYLIRRFMSLYGPKRPHYMKTIQKMKEDKGREVDGLTIKVKNDIGCYANEHSVEETISHFRNHLGINLLESAVKNLLEDFLRKHPRLKNVQSSANADDISSLEESNPVCCSQTETHAETQNNCSSVQRYQSPLSFKSERLSGNIVEESIDYTASQQLSIVSQESNPTCNVGLPKKMVSKNKLVNSDNDVINVNQQYPPVANSPILVDEVKEKSSPTVQNIEQLLKTQEQQQVEVNKNAKRKVGAKKKKRRGKYSSFSPELRAEIGKFAVEHGCLKASTHFSRTLGQDLPESTARGIKKTYLEKLKYSEVTSLGYMPRGRTPLLGKYDEFAQGCLKELIKSGERATSYLAIVTARNILLKYEPNLLKENGGNIDLNSSWAKSFLKRLGLRNNS